MIFDLRWHKEELADGEKGEAGPYGFTRVRPVRVWGVSIGPRQVLVQNDYPGYLESVAPRF